MQAVFSSGAASLRASHASAPDPRNRAAGPRAGRSRRSDPRSLGLTTLFVALLAVAGPAEAGPERRIEQLLEAGRVEDAQARCDKLIDKAGKVESIDAPLAEACAATEWQGATPPQLLDRAWLDRFAAQWPATSAAREARRRAAAIAQTAAANDPVALKAVAAAYPETETAAAALEQARELTFRGASDRRSTAEMRAFLDEFPDAPEAEEAQALLLDFAFDDAEELGTSAGWRALLDEHPSHPRRRIAERRLVDARLREALEGGPVALAAFAEEFPDDERSGRVPMQLPLVDFEAALGQWGQAETLPGGGSALLRPRTAQYLGALQALLVLAPPDRVTAGPNGDHHLAWLGLDRAAIASSTNLRLGLQLLHSPNGRFSEHLLPAPGSEEDGLAALQQLQAQLEPADEFELLGDPTRPEAEWQLLAATSGRVVRAADIDGQRTVQVLDFGLRRKQIVDREPSGGHPEVASYRASGATLGHLPRTAVADGEAELLLTLHDCQKLTPRTLRGDGCAPWYVAACALQATDLWGDPSTSTELATGVGELARDEARGALVYAQPFAWDNTMVDGTCSADPSLEATWHQVSAKDGVVTDWPEDGTGPPGTPGSSEVAPGLQAALERLGASPVGSVVQDAAGQTQAHPLPGGAQLVLAPSQDGASVALLWDGQGATTLPLPAGRARYEAAAGLVLVDLGDSVAGWDVLSPEPLPLEHDFAGLDWLVRDGDIVFGHVHATERWRRVPLAPSSP